MKNRPGGKRKLITGMMVHDNSLWCKILGHPSIKVLKSLEFLSHSKDSELLNKCHVCPLANKLDCHFLSVKLSNVYFDVVHMDLWGSYKTPNFD